MDDLVTALLVEIKLALNSYLKDLVQSPVQSLVGRCHSLQPYILRFGKYFHLSRLK